VNFPDHADRFVETLIRVFLRCVLLVGGVTTLTTALMR